MRTFANLPTKTIWLHNILGIIPGKYSKWIDNSSRKSSSDSKTLLQLSIPNLSYRDCIRRSVLGGYDQRMEGVSFPTLQHRAVIPYWIPGTSLSSLGYFWLPKALFLRDSVSDPATSLSLTWLQGYMLYSRYNHGRKLLNSHSHPNACS